MQIDNQAINLLIIKLLLRVSSENEASVRKE